MGRRGFISLLALLLATACGGSEAVDGTATGPASRPSTDVTAPTPDPSETSGSHGDFVVEVTTDRASYQEGQTVDFTVEVCNLGAATETEGSGGREIPFSFAIVDEDGQVVADDSHAVHTLELLILPWGPGQCRTEQGDWDQHHWNRPADEPSEPPEIHGTPQRGQRVPPGEYRVRVHAAQGSATSAAFRIDP